MPLPLVSVIKGGGSQQSQTQLRPGLGWNICFIAGVNKKKKKLVFVFLSTYSTKSQSQLLDFETDVFWLKPLHHGEAGLRS